MQRTNNPEVLAPPGFCPARWRYVVRYMPMRSKDLVRVGSGLGTLFVMVWFCNPWFVFATLAIVPLYSRQLWSTPRATVLGIAGAIGLMAFELVLCLRVR